MKSAALAFALCLLAATPAAADEIRIAITFDDLPSHDLLPRGTNRMRIAQQIIAALKDAGAPPIYGFVNGIRFDDDPASRPVLQLWRDAGFPLGNHTWSHMNLSDNDLPDWEADTLKNEPAFAPLAGDTNWHWLRYPYLAEGETVAKHDAARAFLAAQGYRIAPVTMSFDDYLWNAPYARCVARNRNSVILRMEKAWLAAALGSLAYYHDLSRQLYGRDIPYVLLMHIGAFDARMMPRLLALYRDRNVKLVTLEEATADPFYSTAANPAAPPAPETLEQAMEARGVSDYPDRKVQVMPFDKLCR